MTQTKRKQHQKLRVGVIVGGAIYGVLGVVEVTREDSVNRMVVVSE